MPPPLQHVSDEELIRGRDRQEDECPLPSRGKPSASRTPPLFDLASSELHRESLLFAVLIYDFRHAEIIKVLKDDAYWDSLDSTVGAKITVFAFHCPASRSSKSSPHPLRFQQKVRKLFGDRFGTQEEWPMPAILFFQTNKRDMIGSYFVKVEGTSIEETFRDARLILKTASEAIASVTPENFKNRQEIFDLVEERVRQQRAGRSVVGAAKAVIPLKAFLSIFLGIFGLGTK